MDGKIYIGIILMLIAVMGLTSFTQNKKKVSNTSKTVEVSKEKSLENEQESKEVNNRDKPFMIKVRQPLFETMAKDTRIYKIDKSSEGEFIIWFYEKKEEIPQTWVKSIHSILSKEKEYVKVNYSQYLSISFFSLGTHQASERGTCVGWIFLDEEAPGELWFKGEKIMNSWD